MASYQLVGTIKQICPYCGVLLDKKPSKKTKCGDCGNFIYVRTRPSDRLKVLVTEEQASQIDAEWVVYKQNKKWIEQLGMHGISPTAFEAEKEKISKKFGNTPNDRDVIWALYNSLIQSGTTPGTLKMIYYDMALFLEEESRNFVPLLEKAHEMELLNYKNSGVIRKVRVLAGNNSCEECSKQNGKILSIDGALKEMPIPCKRCSTKLSGNRPGFCRCIYISVIS